MIVSVTRADLRDEFAMADEAFALSPISARATQPREEDYNAISEAFMETSRGRWFLGEYAKRNRNADTRMVLDAVARIEETIAAQKKPVPDNSLAEALVAIKAALIEARAAATTAVGELAIGENLAPARKGARVIREIAWRLREIGADGRICDLIDSQVGAIEGACAKVAATDAGPALSAAFDLVEDRIKAFDESEPAAPQPAEKAVASAPPIVEDAAPGRASSEVTSSVARVAEEAILSPAPAVHDEAPAASIANDAEALAGSSAAEPIAAMAGATDEALEARVGVADSSSEAVDVTDEAAEIQDAKVQDAKVQDAEIQDAEAQDAEDEAYDDALLEMVAFEMGAPDPIGADEPAEYERYESQDASETAASETASRETEASSETEASGETYASDEVGAATLSPAEPVLVADRPEPVSVPAVQPAPTASAEPPPEPSLGSSLLASGILQARASRPDPLAPIRRMTQAEKIAFFS
jgi:hypothetical protein